MTNTTFIINGGAGRVICAIPALEKYERLNPHNDFRVIVQGWESLFWSHPTLQHRTFGAHQKGTFEQHIKHARVVVPEPYHNQRFYNQEINLIQAFDEEINHTHDHDDLNYNCLFLSSYEIIKSQEFVNQIKQEKKKRKVVVLQPFGSSAELANNQIIDRSNRSLQLHAYNKIVQYINNDCVILYASQTELRPITDKFSVTFDHIQPYHRTLMSMIYHCDLFVGCCSVGQHVARSLNKPGLILMGGTSEYNYSYPDHFTIYRKPNRIPQYVPWRLSDVDCEFVDRANDGIINFTDTELDQIIDIIKQKLSSSTQEQHGTASIQYD
jgi:ADP-heptose:LPS heptosyltransferase